MQGYQPIPQGQIQGQYMPTAQPGTGGYVPPMQPGGYSSQPNPQGYYNQPIPQPGYVGPPLFGNIQYVYVPDPMVELANSTSVQIRQEVQLFEQISGCESPNRYYVFSQSPQGGMKLLFKCKEYSECCQRNCCPADAREFNMYIKHIANASNLDENFSNNFINVNKPFKCTCCCLERPEMLVNFAQNNSPLGRIKQLFTCCDPEFNVYDNTGNKKYFITADCCQCGLCCKNNVCGKMSEVIFNIYPSGNISSPCGSIIKKPANFAELITSADSYQVNFPVDATPNDKMMLIIAGLMIDYQYFEEKAGSNNAQHQHHYNY